MADDKLRLTINGEEKEFDIYVTFVAKELKKGYIIYSDHSKDENGNEIVMVSYYDSNVGPTQLFEVTSQQELDLAHDVLSKIEKIAKGGD